MRSRFSGILLLLLVLLAIPAWGQTPSGEISGTVVDASGLAVPGVTITLTNQATNVVRNVQTNESGLYVITAIPPGTYDLKAELTGFGTVERKSIVVQVGSAIRIALTLQVGNLSETVEVTAGSPLIQTENAAISTVIENRAIVELPLNGRNYLQLASLIPGATTNGPSSSQGKQRMGGQRNSFALNVAGQRIHFNHYSLDGVENTDLNFNSYMLLPSVDALEEFNIVSGLFDAEYGRAIAQVNVSTKSGSNKFRGTVFEFLRHSSLDAKNFFDRQDLPIPPFKRNQYGFTLSGPVVLPKIVDGRNKLFFMFNWEGLRENKSLTQTPSLPLTAWRTGDFSGLRDASGNLIPIYDPATRVFDAAGNVLQAPTQFPGNRIPANRIHPVSQKLLAYYPLPQQEIDRPQLRERRSAARQCRPVHLPDRFHPGQIELDLPPQHLARARLRSVRDPEHGHQHGHRRAAGRVQQHAHVRLEQAQRHPVRVRLSQERPHLAARQQRERRQGARHQPAERQPAVLGRAQHRRHGAVGPRRRERRAVHQRRQDAPDRRQLHLDRRQAFVQVRRRAPARHLQPDRRRRDARPIRVRRPLYPEPAAAGGAAGRRRLRRLPPRQLQQLGRRRSARRSPISGPTTSPSTPRTAGGSGRT